MTSRRFYELFGAPPRSPESPLEQRHMDLAASIQKVTEDVVMKIAVHMREITGSKNLCLAGGVALNCVANGKLLREKIFDRIWIQPAAGDAGGALGAALLGAHQYFRVPRPPVNPKQDRMNGSYLGPRFSNEEVRAFLDYYGYPYDTVTDDERAKIVAKALSEDKVVGYMVGRMEFGPRSLGARSILGDARSETAQRTINLRVKFRESFRPFAPSVAAEHSSEYFELDAESPYMLLVAPVREDLRTTVQQAQTEDMLQIVNQKRSTIPAITHVDYSARVQSVDGVAKPDYKAVLDEFRKLTGYSVIVNTSFNVRGEPIVCTAQDAYKCFMRTDMEVLVLENQILWRDKQPKFEEKENWRDEYGLD
jgi:carbamoyltransferase